MINEDLVLNNLNLAYKVAYKYSIKFGNLVELEELQSLCFIGLTKAAKNFNKELNYEFSTFAWKVMQNEIYSYISKNKDTFKNISISKEIGEDSELQDVIPDDFNLEESVTDSVYVSYLHELIKELSEKEQDIINNCLCGLTTYQIADKLDMSQATVHKIYKKALNKLRYKFLRYVGGDNDDEWLC